MAAVLTHSRGIERLRGMLRDVARLNLIAARTALDDAENTVRSASNQLSEAVVMWQSSSRRQNLDPTILDLAGAHVVAADAKEKAALLDAKIGHQRCDEAASVLAEAEARLEGASEMRRGIQREQDRLIEEHVAREAEDAFVRRIRA